MGYHRRSVTISLQLAGIKCRDPHVRDIYCLHFATLIAWMTMQPALSRALMLSMYAMTYPARLFRVIVNGRLLRMQTIQKLKSEFCDLRALRVHGEMAGVKNMHFRIRNVVLVRPRTCDRE